VDDDNEAQGNKVYKDSQDSDADNDAGNISPDGDKL